MVAKWVELSDILSEVDDLIEFHKKDCIYTYEDRIRCEAKISVLEELQGKLVE